MSVMQDIINMQLAAVCGGHSYRQSTGSIETPAAALRSEASGIGPRPSRGPLLAAKLISPLPPPKPPPLAGRGALPLEPALLLALVTSLKTPLSSAEGGRGPGGQAPTGVLCPAAAE